MAFGEGFGCRLPGLAGAVLQGLLAMIQYLIYPLFSSRFGWRGNMGIGGIRANYYLSALGFIRTLLWFFVYLK